MSWQNLRNCNLELVLSIPDIIPCVKKDFWFPISSIDVPSFEITRDVVGILPNLIQGGDLSDCVELGYKQKFYDYYSAPRINKKGVYKIHCSMFIKTDGDINVKQCLETWLKKHDNIYVPSIVKGYYEDNGNFMSEEINCTKTFISDLKVDFICDKEYIDFTFICEDMIVEKR